MADEKTIHIRVQVSKDGVTQDTAMLKATVDMAGADVACFSVEAPTDVAQVVFPGTVSGSVDVLFRNLGENAISLFSDAGGTQVLSVVQPEGVAFLTGISAASVYVQAADEATTGEMWVSES